jgi:hypothetical protein
MINECEGYSTDAGYQSPAIGVNYEHSQFIKIVETLDAVKLTAVPLSFINQPNKQLLQH